MAKRYDIAPCVPGGWAVVDVETGEAARVNDVPQTGLSLEDADDLADLLTRLAREAPRLVN